MNTNRSASTAFEPTDKAGKLFFVDNDAVSSLHRTVGGTQLCTVMLTTQPAH